MVNEFGNSKNDSSESDLGWCESIGLSNAPGRDAGGDGSDNDDGEEDPREDPEEETDGIETQNRV